MIDKNLEIELIKGYPELVSVYDHQKNCHVGYVLAFGLRERENYPPAWLPDEVLANFKKYDNWVGELAAGFLITRGGNVIVVNDDISGDAIFVAVWDSNKKCFVDECGNNIDIPDLGETNEDR